MEFRRHGQRLEEIGGAITGVTKAYTGSRRKPVYLRSSGNRWWRLQVVSMSTPNSELR